MNFFSVAVLLVTLVATQSKHLPKSSAITLKNYYESHPSKSRIISGQLASKGQFPHQAAIWMYRNTGNTTFCGGTLISTRWVLTAAHCAEGISYWDIKLGGIRLDIFEVGQVMVRSDYGIIHPNYNQYLNNDIALIRLPSDVALSSYIKVMRLPRRDDVGNALTDIEVTVSGWGKTSDAATGTTNNLNWVKLTTISNQICTLFFNPQTIISSTICCKGDPEHSPCRGDSGGSLIRKESDGQLTQIGVVSFVSPAGCANEGPSGFVRTASFLDWINQNTGIAVRP